MARPKALDPAVAMSIYPPSSLRQAIIEIAEIERRKPAEMAVMLIEESIQVRGKPSKKGGKAK